MTIGTTISPSCAQPSEKEISDFVFEHGKGAAHFCVHKICISTNNVVFRKYLNQISKKTTPPIIVCLQNFTANLLKYVKIKSYKHFLNTFSNLNIKKASAITEALVLVRMKGFEPPRRETHGPQPCASASSATSAYFLFLIGYAA